jgi:signal peptidase I
VRFQSFAAPLPPVVMAANVVSQARGKKKSAGSSPIRAAWEVIKSFAGAILIYLVINTFFIAAYRIPSGSMIPTLLVGDWLFVNKLVYGPHIPFTESHLPGYSEPQRGEVIVFESPYQADEAARGAEATPTLVKRMVGMPGDTLFMRKGLLYVNGIPQRQGFGTIGVTADGSQPGDVDPLFDWQHKVELKQSRFGAAPAQPTHDNWGPLVVPSGHYFMMGDNRYQSKDSRYWGLVPRENIRGRPIFVYYSYRADDSDRPLPFITDIRYGRIGTRIR